MNIQCDNLNPKYTFDNFIIGEGNKYAFSNALAVAYAPSKIHKLLFIHGKSGRGKTHLMHAIANFALKRNSDLNVLFVTAETFTNEYIDSIKKNTTADFRAKYRNVDILLFDDIQFIANEERLQLEFLDTFNDLYHRDKQIVISCDKPSKSLDMKYDFSERLLCRFGWGISVGIQAPSKHGNLG